MWNSDSVKPAPTSWGVMLDPKQAAKYKGKISAYDDPIYIADAAVYLKTHEPDLEIENPYQLNEEQFEAAVSLLKEQRPFVGEYWSEATKQISAFANGDSDRRHHLAVPVLRAPGRREAGGGEPRQPGLPPLRGRDRLVGHVDDQLGSQTSQLHVHVDGLDRLTEGQRRSGGIFGEAPSQSLACAQTAQKEFCAKYHAEDPGFWKRVYYWETPLADCGEEVSGECKDYNDWVQAWTSIKG